MAPSRARLALALACAAATPSVADDGDAVCGVEGGCGSGSSSPRETNPEGYYWRRRGGGNEVITSVPYRGPANFSKAPAWSWPNTLDEQVRHSPLIDGERSIYLATAVRIRKFDEHGSVKWTFEFTRQEGKMTASPAIYKGTLYALAYSTSSRTARMFALDMETGLQRWQKVLPIFVYWCASSLMVYNDTIIFPFRDHLMARPFPVGDDGNNAVGAMNASDGKLLWEYVADDIIWNMMVSTPGDGTLLFASQCGGVYRLSWAGQAIWRAGRRNPGRWCGTSGGTLGPNGLFYAEFNDWQKFQGVVAAHRVSNGALVWERSWPLPLGAWQHPAVGRLAPHGRLAVVAPLGLTTGAPQFSTLRLLDYDWVPLWLREFWYERAYLKSKWIRRLLGVPLLPNALVALDAETGQDIWWVVEEPWDRYAMAGDEERFIERMKRAQASPQTHDTMCLPDNQGIPLIAGDGTVYAASSHTGDLASIRDDDGNGVIDATEISIYGTGIGFRNGPSLAPGMLVAAPCWGPMYVFRD